MSRVLVRGKARRGGDASAIPDDPWRLIGAHYFSPFPLDIGNTARPDYYDDAFLDPHGEGDKHLAYGGFLRDRPIISGPRPKPGTTDETKIADLVIECGQAQDMGLDLWWFDCLSLNPTSTRYKALQWMVQACLQTDFKLVPMLDGKTLPSGSGTTSQTAIDSLTPVFQSGCVKYIDGRPLISSFAGELLSVTWWTELLNGLESRLGVRPRLILGFLNSSDANMDAYAPISDGFGRWGNANPNNVRVNGTREAYARSLGKKWCAPVRPIGEYRPKAKAFAESENGELGRLMWDEARADDVESLSADMVQIVTWNDYSENTQIGPSIRDQYDVVENQKYQMEWWRTGVEPDVTVDRLYMTHRLHLSTATATVEPAPKPTAILDGTSTVRDMVEVEVYATAPATVSINGAAGVAVSAGMTVLTAPLTVGTPTATMTRDSAPVVTLVSRNECVASPEVYDFTYYATSATA